MEKLISFKAIIQQLLADNFGKRINEKTVSIFFNKGNYIKFRPYWIKLHYCWKLRKLNNCYLKIMIGLMLLVFVVDYYE